MPLRVQELLQRHAASGKALASSILHTVARACLLAGLAAAGIAGYFYLKQVAAQVGGAVDCP